MDLKRSIVFLFLLGTFFLFAFSGQALSPEKTCRAFLKAAGWQTAGDYTAESVILPQKGDTVWEQYLALQRENGFSMDAFCGKEVRRYAFTIENHPKGKNVQANLYWDDNRIIGGDIMSPALDGFMHGLKIVKYWQNRSFIMQMLQKFAMEFVRLTTSQPLKNMVYYLVKKNNGRFMPF